MKFGAEPKKMAALGGLILLAVVAYLWSSSDSTPTPAPRPSLPQVAVVAPVNNSAKADRKRPTAQPAASGEFKPGIGAKRGEAPRDPTTIDPTLRLDLLAKIQKVQPNSAMRNLFAFGAAQAPPKPLPAVPTNVPKIVVVNKPPVVQQPVSLGPPPPPPPPPITFKYYGFKLSKASGTRQAFLLDGDDIILAAENDMVKRRYKIVKIAVSSITIEDTQYKHSQTLPLQEDAVA